MIADCRVQKADIRMTKRAELAERLLGFAAGCMALSTRLSRTVAGRYLYRQLMRAGASAGANYEEACAAESRADFVHKMQIVLKELREASYWLRLAERGRLIVEAQSDLLQEADELVRVMARSVITAKSGAKRRSG